MIARRRHGHGEALKEGSVVVHDGAGLAVHEMSGANYAAAEGFADGLVPQTDSEYRDFPGEVTNESDADARLARRAGTGGNDDFFRTHALDFAHRDLIVAAHFDMSRGVDLRAQFADILHQVVGEGIVVVEYEDHALALLISAYTGEQFRVVPA